MFPAGNARSSFPKPRDRSEKEADPTHRPFQVKGQSVYRLGRIGHFNGETPVSKQMQFLPLSFIIKNEPQLLKKPIKVPNLVHPVRYKFRPRNISGLLTRRYGRIWSRGSPFRIS